MPASSAAINGGSHVQPNPVFPGDTLYAWTEVLDKWPVQSNAGPHLGALRLRTRATKDLPCETFPPCFVNRVCRVGPGS